MGSRPRVSETRVSAVSPLAEIRWYRWQVLHPHCQRSRRCASPFGLHRQKMEHPQGCAPCYLPYQDSPSLSTGWMHGRSGRICTALRLLMRELAHSIAFAAIGNWTGPELVFRAGFVFCH